MTRFEALNAAIKKVGSQAKLATLLGVDQTAVSKWYRITKELPPIHVIAVEQATGVSRHDLRPDIYPRTPDYTNLVSDMDCGEYGNRTPILDKTLDGVAA